MKRSTRLLSLLLALLTLLPLLPAMAVSSAAESTNLALHKTVTAAVNDNGTNCSCITDGSTGGHWDGGYGPSEFLIDLGTGCFIESFKAYPYYGDGRSYHYEIYTSLDGFRFTKVAEKNDGVAETSAGDSFPADPSVSIRYIRVIMYGNTVNGYVHMKEFQAYGVIDPDYVEPEPIEGDPFDPDNVAYGKPARSGLNRAEAGKVTDGNQDSYWSGTYYPAYVDVDLLDTYALSEISLWFPVRSDRYYYYTVYGSNDLATFDRLAQKRSKTVADDNGDVYEVSGSYRFIRVYVEYVSDSGSAYFGELRVHGTPTETNTEELRIGDIEDILGVTSFAESDYAAPITESETVENLYGIIDRTVGAAYRSWFNFNIVPKQEGENDYYVLTYSDGTVTITAPDGVCAAAGLNYYYKYYCKVEISEQARQTKMPAAVVPFTGSIRRETPYEIRYAFNYCTMDYSFAFYGEEDFQKENDWLALNGVNVVLDLAGQEAVWSRFLMHYGYTFDEAKDWLAGPAYYAWQFMDNCENFGGPVTDAWVTARLELARSSQRFKNSLGMQTVLQGYAGMIPTDFADHQPDVAILKQGGWCGLTRPDMIRTDGALYDEYAAYFYECERWAFGETSNYYAADPFHEGGIRPSDLSDSTIAAELLSSLLAYDPDAVWMVQAWWSNPSVELLRGMGSNREDHVLILDLTADSAPKWSALTYGSTTVDEDEFNGTSWVWCMLENYGGNPSMDAQLTHFSERLPNAYAAADHMKGVGIISEATNDNPVAYELLWAMVWETKPLDLSAWLDEYVVRRYGAASDSARAAWDILLQTVYSFSANTSYVMARLPENVGSGGIPYNEPRLERAFELLIEDFDTLVESEGYRYDLTEIMRQMVNNYALFQYNDVLAAFSARDLTAFRAGVAKFLNAFDVLDEVLGTQSDLLAGQWIGRAADWAGEDDFAYDSLTMNAKALITTWAGASSCSALPDYAYRNYQGMMIDVYKTRWANFLAKKEANLVSGTPVVNMSQGDYFHFYWEWVMNTPEYTRVADDSAENLRAVIDRVQSECWMTVINPANVGNIAMDKAVTVSASYNTPGSSGGYGSNAVDGENATYWDGGEYSKSPWIVVDLGDTYHLTGFNVVNYADGHRFYKYRIQCSLDGKTWGPAVVNKTATSPATAAGDSFTVDVNARYIKLTGSYNSSNSSFHLGELRAYGEKVELYAQGDVNCDGIVNIQDVSSLLAALGSSASLPGETDLDGDGTVSIRDVSKLLAILAG